MAALDASQTPLSKAANLERSLQLLDSALGSPAVNAAVGHLNVSAANFDVTQTIELTRPFDFLGRSRAVTVNKTLDGGDVTHFNKSLTLSNPGVGLLDENPGVRATETLFDEFLTTISAAATSAGGGGVESSLDSIAEFEQMVADQVDVLR
jgi:hypothetical protein